MDYTIRKFASHEEADKAVREYYRSLTPERRVEILLELVETYSNASCKGFERVHRFVKLESRLSM